ncbi:hypothetical protein JOF39_000743 [Glutamicibacter protophormiae]|uniref:Secreted peptide n=1 Tax=Glutamicibacter protophormiae TaxID=37930 RepID=A0ABS4XN13_GLUPR|nr:hypothetical protein [Glutamicibacter protophormiae]
MLFPISTVTCVAASFYALLANCFFSRAVSACFMVSLPFLGPVLPLLLTVLLVPGNPASRNRRHTTICGD